MLKNRRIRARAITGLRVAAVAVFMSIVAACRSDVTGLDDQRVSDIYPSFKLDTSFVGDTVVSYLPVFASSTCDEPEFALFDYIFGSLGVTLGGDDGPLPTFPACWGLGNFDVTWNSSNPSVSAKVGSPVQHVTTGFGPDDLMRAASLSVGTARLGLTPSLEVVDGVAAYRHDIVVLPAPDRMEVPDVIALNVGQSAPVSATVRNGSGPRVNTGTVLWGPSSSVASITATDTMIAGRQTDGRVVTIVANPLIVKGLVAGQVQLTVQYKKAISILDGAPVLTAPVMFEKKILVLVGGSVKIVTPNGPQLDPASSLSPVNVGSTRQYRLLNQNDVVIPNSSIKWESSAAAVASIDTAGVAKCLTAGKPTVKGTVTGSTLSATTTITCNSTTPPAPTITVSPTPLSLVIGQSAPVTATVTNASGTSPVSWVSSDPTIVTVSPANVAASASGSQTTFTGVKAGGPVDVTASYTANGVTVTATVKVTVTAPTGNGVTAIFLDPVAAEYTGASAGNFYRARLFDAQGNEVSATSDGGGITYTSNDTGAITIDASSGLALAKAVTATRTTTLTATYTKNNQVVATTTSAVIVNSVGTAGMGAVQFSIAGDVRKIKIGQTIQFEVIVRDKNGIKQLPGQITVPTLTVSSASALEIAPVASDNRFFYNMTAKALPSSSFLNGIINAVSIKASTDAASATTAMVIVQ